MTKIESVAPLVGAWIEIFTRFWYRNILVGVAPLVGAWIEIVTLW